MSCLCWTLRFSLLIALSFALGAPAGADDIDWDRVKRDWDRFSASEQAVYRALSERDRSSLTPASAASTRTPADTCGDATHDEVASLPFSTSGNTADWTDTLNLAASGHCAGGGNQWGWTGVGPEIVYRVRVDVACSLAVQMTPTTTSADLALYVVTDCANLAASCVAVNDGGAAGVGETLEFAADPNLDYLVIVDGYNGTAGTFDLTITDATSVGCTLVPVRVQSFSVE